ncbi:MAG: c-type cytochrome [Chitinophagaceae bacterium]|nr:c-type cytochrome [Chitinophagaceae bacterium]
MKSLFRNLFITAVFIGAGQLTAFSQSGGDAIFKANCSACHTIGKGKLVGPDLSNVENRRPKQWIVSFIKSSQTVVKSGDKYADSLFKAFNQMPMPDHPNLTNAQIDELLAYITKQSSSAGTATAITELPPGNAETGRLLFLGDVRFANRGAACNSCHNVDIKGSLSGGALGKDLTHAITRLSASGVAAIVSGLPFPQMKETYTAHPVKPQEIADIVAFLTTVDKQAPANPTNTVGAYLLFGGAAGLTILAILYSLFWIKRKKGPVNIRIFNRQLKSA